MARLNLVIADSDEDYVRSVVNYLGANYSQKFQINYFTQQIYLASYLEQNDKWVDVLLISPELFYDAIPKNKVKAMAVLSGGILSQTFTDYEIINKYQTGDKLVSSIIGAYTKTNPDEIQVQSGSKGTRTIAVYSPVGGCGKTSIALACAIQSAQEGMKTFYLNLEQAPSTSLFFESFSESSISLILYFLREKNKNLGLKIESIRAIDSQKGIHYFCPPMSVGEYEELKPTELAELISQLKQLGQYDVIFVDMSSGIDIRNLAILENCDEILLVSTFGDMSRIKLETLQQELSIMADKGRQDIMDKLMLVINKCNSPAETNVEVAEIGGWKAILCLPKAPGLLISQSGKCTLNLNNEFGETLRKFVRKYRET